MTQPETIVLAVGLVGLIAAIMLRKPDAKPAPPANIMDPRAWEIGPADYPGGNPSAGAPLHPVATPDGWAIDTPNPTAAAGHVHYVTVPCAPLTGKQRVTLRGRWEIAPGVKLVPAKFPDAPALLTLYFQRAGDDYTMRCEAYRWWASFATVQNPQAGTFEITARFDQNWTAVQGSTAEKNPDLFLMAKANAARIGFTLGGGDGLGHGVYATGPARLVITSVEIT